MNIYKIISSESTDKIVIAENIQEASKKFVNKVNEYRKYDKIDESCIDKIEKLFLELDIIL